MDISQVTSISKLSRKGFMDVAQQTAEAMTNAVYSQIHKEANSSLNSTRQIYKRNIGQPEMGRLKGTITLTGQLPNMLEQGASAFDMKRGFSRSRKVKRRKKGGWYLTIPFRFASAGAIGESAAFSGGVMPPEIYDIAKDLKASITVPFLGTVRQGDRISIDELKATKFGVLGVRPTVSSNELSSAQRAAYTHKTPKFAGMGRSKAFYQLTSQGKYQSFRRVSDRSAVNSWIHKGLQARNLFEKGLQNADLGDVVARTIDGYLTSQGL